MSAKDYDKVEVKDERTNKEKAIYNHLVIGRDKFLSGWGLAAGGASMAAWACTSDTVDNVLYWIKQRNDIENIIVQTEPLSVAAMCRNIVGVKHISIYKVTETHRYAQPFKSISETKPVSNCSGVIRNAAGIIADENNRGLYVRDYGHDEGAE